MSKCAVKSGFAPHGYRQAAVEERRPAKKKKKKKKGRATKHRTPELRRESKPPHGLGKEQVKREKEKKIERYKKGAAIH